MITGKKKNKWKMRDWYAATGSSWQTHLTPPVWTTVWSFFVRERKYCMSSWCYLHFFFCKRLFNICLKITCTSVSDERLLELVSGRGASTLMRSSRGEWKHAWHISVHGMVDEKEIKSQTFRGGTFLRHRFRFGMYLIIVTWLKVKVDTGYSDL